MKFFIWQSAVLSTFFLCYVIKTSNSNVLFGTVVLMDHRPLACVLWLAEMLSHLFGTRLFSFTWRAWREEKSKAWHARNPLSKCSRLKANSVWAGVWETTGFDHFSLLLDLSELESVITLLSKWATMEEEEQRMPFFHPAQYEKENVSKLWCKWRHEIGQKWILITQ